MEYDVTLVFCDSQREFENDCWLCTHHASPHGVQLHIAAQEETDPIQGQPIYGIWNDNGVGFDTDDSKHLDIYGRQIPVQLVIKEWLEKHLPPPTQEEWDAVREQAKDLLKGI